MTILIDDVDKHWLLHSKMISHSGYVIIRRTIDGKRKNQRLHRLIMNLTDRNLEVDHINGNKLDNRRSNLRIVTRFQNAKNVGPHKDKKGPYKGVYYKSKNTFRVVIQADGVTHRRFGFRTEEEAARAYDELAKQLHGEFAYLNFPNE